MFIGDWTARSVFFRKLTTCYCIGENIVKNALRIASGREGGLTAHCRIKMYTEYQWRKIQILYNIYNICTIRERHRVLD